MKTLARFQLYDILPFIGFNKPKIYLNGHYIKVNSNRLECFKRNQKCIRCKRAGNVWLLQSHLQKESKVSINCFIEKCYFCEINNRQKFKFHTHTYWMNPHLNLYHVGKRGDLLLITQDHIFPKHAGGSDNIDNLQTMCRECNSFKGGMLPNEFQSINK